VGKHNGFILLSSLGFALLFAERGLYAHLAGNQRNPTAAAAIIALSALLVFAGFMAAFRLPIRLMPEDDQTRWIPHTLDFLIGQLGIMVGCVASAIVLAIALYIYLVYPDLLAISWLLRDGFLYLALGAFVYPGFVTFVRYLGFLYQTGGADRLKIITFEVGATVFIAVFGLYQYTVDMIQVLRAGPDEGLLALHLTVRDIWLAALVALIFVWQIGRAGDH
jgi:hypothetical protein